MIKNLPYTAKEHEIKELFSRYGELVRFLVSPFNTLAIAEYESKTNAAAAMENLAYHKFNYIQPIYLEYAPKGFVNTKARSSKEEEASKKDQPEEEEDAEADKETQKKMQRQIYVKNLNFDTREEQLEEAFRESNIGTIKSVKIVRKSENQQSRGYGFVEVDSKESAEKAVKKLQNFLLDGHAIKLSLSTKSITKAQEKEDKERLLGKRKRADKTEQAEIENEEV